MKTYLTKEQAIPVLPNGGTNHTFYNPGFGLVGADWERDDILDKIEKSDIVELTGPGARGMGHGIHDLDESGWSNKRADAMQHLKAAREILEREGE